MKSRKCKIYSVEIICYVLDLKANLTTQRYSLFRQRNGVNLLLDSEKAKEAKLDGRVDPEEDSLGNSSEDSYGWKLRRTISYTPLEHMFGSFVSNPVSALCIPPFDGNNSLYSSSRSSDSGFPSWPSRNLSASAKSSPDCSISLESDTFEPAANDDPKVEGRPKDSDKSRRKSQSHESPTRPPYFKSISSPLKIMNLVTSTVSLGSCASGERSSLKDENKTDGPGEQSHRKFKDAASKPLNKGVSKLPADSLFLSTDDAKETDERVQKEMEEVEEALMSPTLKKPFRERSGTVTAEERVRSSSAPSSPGLDFMSPEVDVQSSTSGWFPPPESLI